ncbi:Wall-associated receptor kinase 2, partial [Bienertia sinuspersici]
MPSKTQTQLHRIQKPKHNTTPSGMDNSCLIIITLWVAITQSMAQNNESPSPLLLSPHCPDKCGNVSIPYPFGLVDGCYLEEDDPTKYLYYKIKCNDSVTPPMPIFGNSEVMNISLDGEMRAKSYISFSCYDSSFQFNTTYENRYTLGSCNDLEDVKDGSCNGVGCCQASLPDGVNDISTRLGSFSNHTKVYDFNPCSVAFVVASDAFKFQKRKLTYDLNYYLDHVKSPVVIDWAVGTENCSVAQAKGNSLCKNNTICEDPKNQVGYRCKCNKGFTGNPYLPQGCT